MIIKVFIILFALLFALAHARNAYMIFQKLLNEKPVKSSTLIDMAAWMITTILIIFIVVLLSKAEIQDW